MRSLILSLSIIVFLFAFVRAQTETVVDPDSGETVVEVVTTNARGVFTTVTLSTLTGTSSSTSTSTSTTSTTTQAAGNQGPVAQPAPTADGDPHGPTPYTYTTVIDGVTTAVPAVFTPTFPATVSTQIPSTGTVLDYSQWLSEFGATNTAANSSSLSPKFSSRGLWALVMSLGVSVLGGVLLLVSS